jgi:hypothetical protein
MKIGKRTIMQDYCKRTAPHKCFAHSDKLKVYILLTVNVFMKFPTPYHYISRNLSMKNGELDADVKILEFR